jgi:hypothetical protein
MKPMTLLPPVRLEEELLLLLLLAPTAAAAASRMALRAEM